MSGGKLGTVAIVDDDPAVLDSLKFALEGSGYAVVAYESAAAFLDNGALVLRCLILDQHMPQMTGLELAAKLRDNGSNLPILLITGTPAPAIVAEAARLGIKKVLEKPPEEQELLSFIVAHPD